MLKKLNGLISFFSNKNIWYFDFPLCAFKIIIITKDIAYTQCERWVIKLSFKRKALGEIMS